MSHFKRLLSEDHISFNTELTLLRQEHQLLIAAANLIADDSWDELDLDTIYLFLSLYLEQAQKRFDRLASIGACSQHTFWASDDS